MSSTQFNNLEHGQEEVVSSSTKMYKPPGASSYTAVSTKDVVVGQDYYFHSGRNTPNFHERLRKGELLPFTWWDQFKVSGEVTIANHSLTDPTGGSSYWNGFRPLGDQKWIIRHSEAVNAIPDDVWAMANAYVQEAMSDIYSDTRMDTLTFAAELHKTVAMFRGVLGRFLVLLARAPDKLWLEGRYGWRILQYDLEDLAEVVANLDNDKFKTRFKERKGKSFNQFHTELITYPSAAGTRYYKVDTKLDYSIRGTCVADIKPPRIGINPFVTAWELITFSFVIDWLFTIGSFINALSLHVLSTKYVTAKGFHLKMRKVQTLDHIDWTSGWSGDGDFRATSECEQTFRWPTDPRFRPYYLPNLNVFKVTDLLALLAQAVRRVI